MYGPGYGMLNSCCACAVQMQGHGSSVGSVSFNHDGSMLATGSYDGTAKLWSIPDGQLMKTLTVS